MKQELTKSDKTSLSTTEIAKRIRKQLKAELKGCKFSVTSKYYSMGSSITVSLMKADRRIKMDFDKIPKQNLIRYLDNRYSLEDLRNLQGGNYHQLNQYTIRDKYDNHWCNGVFLTMQGHQLLKRVVQVSNYYNYDDSDAMTDYYSVNFSFSIQLGKWNKPFIDGEGFKVDTTLDETVAARDEEVKINTAKAQEERRKQDELNQYKKLDKPNIPSGATHIIDGSGLRELMKEERETGRIDPQ